LLTGGNGEDTLAVSGPISSLSFPLNNVALLTLEVFDLDGGAPGGVTVTIAADVLDDVARIQGDGTNDTLNLSVNSFSLTNSSELSGIETINLTNTDQRQTVDFSSGTKVSGLTTIRGTVNSSSVVDDQINIGGDFDFRGITLTDIDAIVLGDNSTRQTIGVGDTTSFGTAEVTGFDVGAGSTTDVFDYQSALRSGNNTAVSATNLSLNDITAAGGDDVISASSSGVIAFQFGVGTADHLDIDLTSSTLSRITSAAQTALESNLTISGDQVTQGQADTDVLLLFNGLDGRDTVIIRYQEGSTSEASFANELSVVAIFNQTISDFNDANIV
jgi:hypothetical protein